MLFFSKKKSGEKSGDTIELDVVPNDENKDSANGKKQITIDSLFQQKPKLSLGNEETLVFDGCIEFDVAEPPKKSDQKKGAMDSFMEVCVLIQIFSKLWLNYPVYWLNINVT